MTRILLVEDDPLVQQVIRYSLEKQKGYVLSVVKTAGEALSLARSSFDIVLMDVLLPDANGIDLCRHLRQWYDCPIIFISCLDDSETIIKALSEGGDDFITKPFDTEVLNARIQANLRRYHQEPNKAARILPSQHRSFHLDEEKHTFQREGKSVHLSNIEFRILSFLIANEGTCYTPREIYENAWGASCAGDTRTVIVHIHNLRQKIETLPNEPRYLKLIWGRGYVFDPDNRIEA